MRDLKSLANKRPSKAVTLHFKLPYYTQWGQSIVVSGSDPVLGSWNLKQAVSMEPVHQGGELVWCAKASVQLGFTCEYNYYLVDDSRNVLRWEGGKKRNLVLPQGVKEGDVVEIHDLWQDASEGLFLRSAFKDVIFSGTDKLKKETQALHAGQNLGKDQQEDTVIVQFVISCPLLDAGTNICVTGGVSNLGNWRCQDSLQLSYTGDSLWKADCVIRKDQLPLKYPSFLSFFLKSLVFVKQ